MNNSLVALMTALSLPDICGKAEYPNEKPSDRYIRWYEEWIGKYETFDDSKMLYVSGGIAYELRNSLVHEGSPKIHEDKNNHKKFKLVKENSHMFGGSSLISSNGDRELEINISNLIWKLCRCAEAYYEKNKDKFGFLENVQLNF